LLPEQSLGNAVSLIEWAERLGNQLPDEHLAVTLRIIKEEERSSSDVDSSEPAHDNDPYTDQRWREIKMQPFGARWAAQDELLSYIAQNAESALQA